VSEGEEKDPFNGKGEKVAAIENDASVKVAAAIENDASVNGCMASYDRNNLGAINIDALSGVGMRTDGREEIGSRGAESVTHSRQVRKMQRLLGKIEDVKRRQNARFPFLYAVR